MSKNKLEEDSSDIPEKLKIQEKRGIGNIVAEHYNSVEERGLHVRDQSRIVYMRNFNNWVKSFLLDKYLNLVKDGSADYHKIGAMDLGCGKGGDLLKWQKVRIQHLICADIATTSVEQCQERYTSMKARGRIFTIEYISADCTKVRLQKHFAYPEMKLDLISCQFALHYCFESLSQAETMIRNVSENLRKGCYFVTTFPNANHIISSLKAAGVNSFGNDIFRIQFPEDRPESPSVFGDKYNFFLDGAVDCPEFLVHIPTLVHICKKYDLELVYESTFSNLYEEAIRNRDVQSLLFKMKALERYPPPHGSELSSPRDGDYDHVEEYMKSNGYNEAKSLSLSEWEVINLYMAMAFRKIK